MNAAQIAATLGDPRREGRAWRCRCPLCFRRNFTLQDGSAVLLVTCWNGCDRSELVAELRRRGLLGGRMNYAPTIVSRSCRNDDAWRTIRALRVWRETERGPGSIVEQYLATRGIGFDQWPNSLRFHPHYPRPKDGAGKKPPPFPAMVALVEHVNRGPVAVHATYLKPDGSDKADVPKNEQRACFGPIAGGAVRFGIPRAGEWFAAAEGIETALSVAAACSMPAWAALSASGIKNLTLPPEATNVVICADHDASGTGARAARDAATRWLAESRCVRVAVPPELGADFNDVLTDLATDKIDEARHVA
jgi:putative DNA primase/helicase